MSRSRDEIISLILDSAEQGATRTTLMYKAYLSFEMLEEYLSLLKNQGLIEYVSGEMVFRTTERGRVFLSSISQASIKRCSHQCKKCGMMYACDKTECKDPFYHSACRRCLDFPGVAPNLHTLQYA